jgi:hypothetical protein
MIPDTIVLHSALPLVEFEARLHSVVDRERGWNQGIFGLFFGDNPVTGKFTDDRFRLNRRRYFFHNSFARMFYARYAAEAGGVRIEGHFDVYPSMKWFMRVWLGFAIFFSVVAYSSLVKGLVLGTRSFGDLSGLDLIPLGFVLYGVFFPRFCQWISSGSEQFILDYLEENLVARRPRKDSDLPILDSAMR